MDDRTFCAVIEQTSRGTTLTHVHAHAHVHAHVHVSRYSRSGVPRSFAFYIFLLVKVTKKKERLKPYESSPPGYPHIILYIPGPTAPATALG